MAKLTFTHEITERRNFGKTIVNQTMEIVADYDLSERSLDIEAVNIYQDGVFVAEVSKLLDKAEGNPLTTIIEAIDWDELAAEKKYDEAVSNIEAETEEV